MVEAEFIEIESDEAEISIKRAMHIAYSTKYRYSFYGIGDGYGKLQYTDFSTETVF